MRSVHSLLLLTVSNHRFFGTGFIVTSNRISRSIVAQRQNRFLSANANSDDQDGNKNNNETTEPESNDGSCRSSDMTDRFKYQVNALMGTYDPMNGVDDERQDGNILQGEI